MSETKPTSRRDQILQAAFDVVSRYGYKRMSMDDIAREVGISRPALYQQFKNKADIYRAFLQNYLEQSLEAVEVALATDGPLTQRLQNAFRLSVVEPHRMADAMPHGEELMSLKSETAQDLMDSWSEKLGELLLEALAKEPGVSKEAAAQTASTALNVVAGIKARGLSADDAESALDDLISVIELITKN